MSPDSTVDFQRKLGANHESKILFWRKTSEEILLALNMLQAIKANQVPVLRHDDMDITTTIDLDEHVINGYPNVNSAVYGYCKELLEKTMRRREESSINNETLEDAISELHKNLPTYK